MHEERRGPSGLIRRPFKFRSQPNEYFSLAEAAMQFRRPGFDRRAGQSPFGLYELWLVKHIVNSLKLWAILEFKLKKSISVDSVGFIGQPPGYKIIDQT
jgi:hypothetical protein